MCFYHVCCELLYGLKHQYVVVLTSDIVFKYFFFDLFTDDLIFRFPFSTPLVLNQSPTRFSLICIALWRTRRILFSTGTQWHAPLGHRLTSVLINWPNHNSLLEWVFIYDGLLCLWSSPDFKQLQRRNRTSKTSSISDSHLFMISAPRWRWCPGSSDTLFFVSLITSVF